MPPRNQAGKRGKTGGSCNTTQSDVQEFQRQQKEFLKFENRNEEGRAEQALRLVSFSEALTASLPRSGAMDDAASLSSVNTIHTSSVILVGSEPSESEYVTLEKAASGTEAIRAGHPASKELVKQLERDHEALLRESAPTTKQGKRKATTTQQQGTTMSRRISGGGSGVSCTICCLLLE